MTERSDSSPAEPLYKVGADWPFWTGLGLLGGFYVLLILVTLAADAQFTTRSHLASAIASPEIRYAARLSLFSSVMTTIISLWVAVPIGYLLSRFRAPDVPVVGPALGICKMVTDAILDIPIVLPPLVIGLSLLILFQTSIGQWAEGVMRGVTELIFGRPMGFTYGIPGVILAQFMVAAAFAVRTLRTAFEEITPRKEQVALTLGCTRSQAFWMVVMPEARRGLLAAATLTWARSMGEFGPILVFAGAVRFKTEVLPTTVFLELSVGNIEAAVAVSLMMVIVALMVLVVVRLVAHTDPLGRTFR